MKIQRNPDGTVTVAVLKADETYNAADGRLYIEETVTDGELADVLDAFAGAVDAARTAALARDGA